MPLQAHFDRVADAASIVVRVHRTLSSGAESSRNLESDDCPIRRSWTSPRNCRFAAPTRRTLELLLPCGGVMNRESEHYAICVYRPKAPDSCGARRGNVIKCTARPRSARFPGDIVALPLGFGRAETVVSRARAHTRDSVAAAITQFECICRTRLGGMLNFYERAAA